MRRAIAMAIGASMALAAAGAAAEPARLRVGSKRFTESYILGEIAVELARRGGDAIPEHVQGLGGTAVVYRALEQGSIDLYAEYTGTIAETILHTDAKGAELGAMRAALDAMGIGVSAPLGFENTYALAAGADAARAHHLARVSDLAREAEVRIGVSHEFLGRSDGWPGLAKAYGLEPSRASALDHGLAYEAIEKGSLDVVDAYSTDAKIARYGLVVLEDDRRFFPSYAAVWLYRKDALVKAPFAMQRVLELAGGLDAKTMTKLNAQAELDGAPFDAVARGFVDAKLGRGATNAPPLARRSFVAGLLDAVKQEGPRHLLLVALALALSTLVGVPLGVLASYRPRLGRALVSATGVVQTIPSLALLCFFIPLFGTGVWPALAALFLYGLLPIARNTVVGLDGIPRELTESAEVLGLSPLAQLTKVRLPLASRTILAGVKTSAVLSVGTATLAAFVGAGGFGAPISVGLNLNDTAVILEGAVPAAALALVVEALFAGLERFLVPKGLRLPPRSEPA